MKRLLLLTALAGLTGSSVARADSLTSGSATITFYKPAWDALASAYGAPPVLTLSAFFDQSQANTRTDSQILSDTPGTPSYTNQVYAMNGPTVTNLTGRTTQHTGSIGLGGVSRFAVLGGIGGNLLYGDYTLQYDSARIGLGGSGWYLKGNIPPAGPIFDLLNLTIIESAGSLSISGDLAVTFEVANFLYNTPADTLAVVGSLNFTAQSVATLSSGSATINYDKAAWDTLASAYGSPPVLTLSAFFNQAEANALTQSQLLTDVQAGYSYTNQVYALNGASVTNLPSRYTQPTTFAYTRGDLTNHTGSAGLGGVARFAVLGGVAGNLLYGDYTLQYDTNRLALGGTGWYLMGNIPPAAAAFDLLNVNVVETTNSFTISGDLGVSFEIANLVYATPADALKDVGDIVFTGYTVPLSTPVISQLTTAGGSLIVRATNGLPGSSYSVLSATNVSLPSSAWTTTATGVFDESGACSNAIPINVAEPTRLFRLKQP
jgi:hypothetical protein